MSHAVESGLPSLALRSSRPHPKALLHPTLSGCDSGAPRKGMWMDRNTELVPAEGSRWLEQERGEVQRV